MSETTTTKNFEINCLEKADENIMKKLSFGNEKLDKFIDVFLRVESLGGVEALSYFANDDFDFQKNYENYLEYAVKYAFQKEMGVDLARFPILLAEFLNSVFGRCVSYLENVSLEDITRLVMNGTPVALIYKNKDTTDYKMITGVSIRKTDKQTPNGDKTWEPVSFTTIDGEVLQMEDFYPLVKPYYKNYKTIIRFEDFLYF